MNLPEGFALTLQDRPMNCAAVAIVNALNYLRCAAGVSERAFLGTPSVRIWEQVIDNKDPSGKRDPAAAAVWLSLTQPVDVMHMSLLHRAPSTYEGRLLRALNEGWVLITPIDSDYTPGGRHVVVLVPHAFTILDGKRAEPYRWTFKDLQEHHMGEVMGLRISLDACARVAP